MSYSVFHIPKNIINDMLKKNNMSNWEKYDENCLRAKIKLVKSDIKYLYELTNLQFNINYNETVCHYIKYSINNKYSISKHKDYCKITIIVYLDKDPDIKEKFYIENNLLNINPWSKNTNTYGALVMWCKNDEGLLHQGELIGSGKRNILCLFLG